MYAMSFGNPTGIKQRLRISFSQPYISTSTEGGDSEHAESHTATCKWAHKIFCTAAGFVAGRRASIGADVDVFDIRAWVHFLKRRALGSVSWLEPYNKQVKRKPC